MKATTIAVCTGNARRDSSSPSATVPWMSSTSRTRLPVAVTRDMGEPGSLAGKSSKLIPPISACGTMAMADGVVAGGDRRTPGGRPYRRPSTAPDRRRATGCPRRSRFSSGEWPAPCRQRRRRHSTDVRRPATSPIGRRWPREDDVAGLGIGHHAVGHQGIGVGRSRGGGQSTANRVEVHAEVTVTVWHGRAPTRADAPRGARRDRNCSAR